MEDLKPCPFCGKIPEVELEYMFWPIKLGPIDYWVECVFRGCNFKVRTLICKSEEEAINLWNGN